MKTILITAYAINPYKGSEDGMGWNFVLQAARFNKVIAVTRVNNGPAIEQYMGEHPEQCTLYNNIEFRYFDWPRWMIFWKKGPLLSMIYYYGWQFTLACWLWFHKAGIDIVHNLNFHNDWTPSFLWLLGKPMVWGPIGHHPAVPKEFMRPVYGKKAYKKDRRLWQMKNFFWQADPFLWITRRKAGKILCMNSDAARRLKLPPHRFMIMPSVASEPVPYTASLSDREDFVVLSVGRFVPLKGFDITIRSFSAFYHQLPAEAQVHTKLVLVGSGPSLPLLQEIIAEEGLQEVVEIIAWIPRKELAALYRSSSVFLFPSHEGAGMVVAEAMSYGLPVVCLDNAGPGELVHPGSSLKVPYTFYDKTIYRFSEELLRLYEQPALYRKEQQLALQRFREYLLWEVRGAQLKQVYEQLPCKETKKIVGSLSKVY